MKIGVFVSRWHWKSALLSGCIRAVLFFATNVGSHGGGAARRAALIEFVLRVPMVGALAGVGQAMSRVEPAWKSVLVATATLPLAAHLAELAVHWVAGTPSLRASMLASITLSAVATVFNQFAMRRGVLVVGANGRTLVDDLKQLPGLCAAFVAVPIAWVRSAATRRLGMR